MGVAHKIANIQSDYLCINTEYAINFVRIIQPTICLHYCATPLMLE